VILNENKGDIDSVFPGGMVLRRDDIDEHFGLQITPVIDAANAYHAAKVRKLFDQPVRAIGERE
jgi:hypothetical protein